MVSRPLLRSGDLKTPQFGILDSSTLAGMSPTDRALYKVKLLLHLNKSNIHQQQSSSNPNLSHDPPFSTKSTSSIGSEDDFDSVPFQLLPFFCVLNNIARR